jgi:hypothetical protein
VSSFTKQAEAYEEWPKPYSPNELAGIAKALGLESLSSEMVDELQSIAEGYCWTDLWVPRKGEPEIMGLRWRTRNDHLRRIAKLAGQLALCRQNSAKAQAQFGELMKLLFDTEGIDGPTSQLLDGGPRRGRASKPGRSRKRLRQPQYTDQQLAQLGNHLGEAEANTAFAELRGLAKLALKRKQQPGRPREPRYDLVEDLAEFYKRHTDEEPRRNGPDSDPGPFEKLVLAALEPLEPAARDRAALPRIRDVIRTVLEARAKKSNLRQ